MLPKKIPALKGRLKSSGRFSGGFFCTREIPLNTGVDFIGAAIKVALGEPVSPDELEPQKQTSVIQRYAFPNPGKVVSVSGAEEARKIPGVTEVIVTAREGDIIPAAGDKRPSAAMVLATGATRAVTPTHLPSFVAQNADHLYGGSPRALVVAAPQLTT